MILTKYLIIAIIVTGLATAFSTKLYIEETQDHAVTSLLLEASESNFDDFRNDMVALELKLKDLQKENHEITIKNTETTRTLESLRNREATVLAKKSLVALRINKAYRKRQNKLACTTGDFKLC